MSYSEKLLDAIERQDFSQEKSLLQKALDKDEPEILASLAENLVGLGFTDLAKEIYRSLIARFPKEDLFKIYLAEILLNDGQDDDGLTLLYNVSPDSSAYLDSLLVQADYYQTNGLLETAYQKLLEAEKIAPDEDVVKFGLAELDYLSGHYEQALSRYQDLLKRHKTFSEVNLNDRLFQTLAKLGRYEEAGEVIAKNGNDILDIDSKYQAALVMLTLHKDDQAIKYLNEVIDQSPDYVNAYRLLTTAYEHKNDNEQELRSAQLGIAYNELDPVLYKKGAQAAVRLNDLDTAKNLLQKGIKKLPENFDLRLQLSNLYVRENDNEANIALFAQVDDEDLEPQVHWNLALSYQNLDQSAKAKSEFLLAYPEFKNNSAFLKQMLLFFNTEPNSQDIVRELLEAYLKLEPEDTEMQEMYDELLS
ncbi:MULTISPECIES: tetratricopeptide repeat protein [unclassified Lactobacillus]|uniref:tetratricopeptide repeat protein n=1 Tax=unclassified Lactobacillus TaxID=2620435 RepID=UPI0018DDAB62|nr:MULTISPECIES: tetratricopeptide repeat protein [unclassified Lactobacillus]MBH9989179.1 peptide-binding protein [Lactobacillus sp. M0392]MBI0023790.1 peptide-binding protein [Lactobacillus sp. W8171]MBI0044220.1 peptide-binding protein [Lactobacillus sp. M0393]